MQLNSYPLVDRYNRPGVNSAVAIRTQFINNGSYFDPYDISACTIFNKYANTSPSSVLDAATQIIKTGLPLSPNSQLGVLMNFEISGNPDAGKGHTGDPDDGYVTSQYLGDLTWFPAYTPHSQASGIHRIGVGDYVAVLDGSRDLSGGFNLNYGFELGPEVKNGASSVAEYIDVWTVRLNEQSEYQTFINTFSLYNDTFITLTEPLLVTASNKLHTKHINVGMGDTLQDILISTELTVQNRNLTDSVRNIIEEYSITDISMKIHKIDDGQAVPTSTAVTVTDANIRVTGDNTIIYPISSSALDGPGNYVVQVSYGFLNQVLNSRPMYFVVE